MHLHIFRKDEPVHGIREDFCLRLWVFRPDAPYQGKKLLFTVEVPLPAFLIQQLPAVRKRTQHICFAVPVCRKRLCQDRFPDEDPGSVLSYSVFFILLFIPFYIALHRYASVCIDVLPAIFLCMRPGGITVHSICLPGFSSSRPGGGSQISQYPGPCTSRDGSPGHTGDSVMLPEIFRCRESGIRYDKVHIGAYRSFNFLRAAAHSPDRYHLKTVLLQQPSQRGDRPAVPVGKRSCPEDADPDPAGVFLLVRLPSFREHVLRILKKGKSGTVHIVIHTIAWHIEGPDMAPAFYDTADRLKVRPGQIGDRGVADRYEPGMRVKLIECLHDIIDELFIISKDRVPHIQSGQEDIALLIVPADLVMRVVGRIAARRIVDHDHPAKLIEGGSDPRHISGPDRKDPVCFFHAPPAFSGHADS